MTTDAKTKPTKAILALIETIRQRAKQSEEGVSSVSGVEVAKLLRFALRREFPGVKFSVRCRSGSIGVTYPSDFSEENREALNALCGSFEFGGFDGMIDLAYYRKNWLHADGSMTPAASQGTEGSRGTVPAFVTDCPEPGAVIVQYGPKYIFPQRDWRK